MIVLKQYLRFLFCLSAIVVLTEGASGQTTTLTYVNSLSGSALTQNASLVVTDPVSLSTTNTATVLKPYPIKDIITFMINESATNFFVKDSAVAIFKLYQKQIGSHLVDSSQTDTLTVTYDTTGGIIYKAKNSLVFYGEDSIGFRLIYNIAPSTLSTAQLGSLTLQVQMITTPDYIFTNTTPAVNYISFDTTTIASQGEITAKWPVQYPGADAFDLEWAYIDSGSVTTINTSSTAAVNASIFANNATRVTVTNSKYSIPLIEGYSGILFARVRSVQYKPGGGKITSNWSTNNLTTTYNGATGLAQYSYIGYQRNLDWQSTTSFAEGGKRKVVVQYYDGSLRGRQVVTKDNTTNTTIVGETLYDYQGRPTIQVLPAPTLDSIIQYTPLFNVGINGAEYDKNLYDSLTSAAAFCSSAAPPMDSAEHHGASRYYSGDNPLLYNSTVEAMTELIPNAQDYPFSQTRYTQDNTGRISSQGGVGPMFQLGGGHTTNYYYGGFPAQQEIDALFGTEVGNKSHYFKNMVQDANGQFSVSYVDMHGRTIATALAGQPPTNTSTLSSYNTNTITESLADSSTNNTQGLTMQSVKSLLVSSPGSYVFNYSLGGQDLSDSGCTGPALCYDCLYDLEIKITSDCDNQKLPGGKPFDTVLHNFSLANIDTMCKPQGFVFVDTLTLTPGNYEITKSLTVDQTGENYYRDSIYSKHNTCISLDSMISYYKGLQVDTGCIANTIDSSAYYFLKQQLLADMTPTSGQYAQTSGTGDANSIFYISTSNPETPYPYQWSSVSLTYPPVGSVPGATVTQPLVYLDANNNPDTVIDDYTGARVIPQQLDTAQFVRKFKPSWANTLLYLHPEFMKLYVDSINTYASGLWDIGFSATNTFEQAKRLGYLDPTGNTSTALLHQYYVSGASYDPILSDSVGIVEDSMITYRTLNTFTGSYAANSIYALACSIVECTGVGQLSTPDAPGPHACPVPDTSVFDTTAMCTGDLNMAWIAFRTLYLQIKQNLIGPSSLSGMAPSASSLISAGHIPNFMSAADGFNQAGSGNINYNQTIATDSASAQDSAASFYCATCAAYATQWMQQLSGCTEYSPAAIQDTIIPELEQVCEKGSDLSHPFGSRSISPDSSYTYANFDSVIAAYNRTHGDTLNTSCNADVLTNPQAYNNQQGFVDVPVYTKPDSCQCSRISQLNTEYAANKLSGETFSAYLLRVYDTQIADSSLTTLLNACSASAPTCHYFTQPIMLPPALQCNTGDICISCAQIQAAYTGFTAKYGNITLTIGDALDTNQRKNNQLFADYMNNQFGFTKQSYEYLDFMQQCDSFQANNPLTLSFASHSQCLSCDSLQSMEAAYFATVSNPSNSSQSSMLLYIDSVLTNNGFQTDTAQIDQALTSCNNGYLQNINYGGIGVFSKYQGNLDIGANGSDFSIEFWTRFPNITTEQPLLYFNTNKTYGYFPNVFKGFYIYGNAIAGKGYLFAYFGDSSTTNYIHIRSADTIAPNQWYHIVITRSGNDTSGFKIFFNGLQTHNVLVDGSASFNNGGSITPIYTSIPNDSGMLVLSNSWAGNRSGIPAYMKNLRLYSRVISTSEISTNCTNLNGYPSDTTGMRLWAKMNEGTNLALDYSNYNTQSDSFRVYTSGAPYYGYGPVAWPVWIDTVGSSESPSCLPHTLNVLCNSSVLLAPTLCGKATPVFGPVTAANINSQCNNCTDSTEFAVSGGTARWNAYEDSTLNRFDSLYYAKCLQAYRSESFTVTHPESEYHYTLYYYDQAGNLVKTVPPQGVHPAWRQSWFDSVAAARINGTLLAPLNDSLITTYCYNSLNQVTAQQTPDGGIGHSFYDRLGRIVLSQNAKQAAASNYSYTLYDTLGRLTEVGQLSGTGMTTLTARTLSSLSSWMAAALPSGTQITHTYYDLPYSPFTGTTIIGQRNLRSRVSWAGLYDSAADVAAMVKYSNATFYTYDVHGNVDTLLQDYGNSLYKPNSMNSVNGVASGNRWKKTVYNFDLISGKVNLVGYQVGSPDQFYHSYVYDAENRITNVVTSADSITWDNDAYYTYYAHGPLYNTQLGNQKVQDLAHAYTLQGWLKGVNGTEAAFLPASYDGRPVFTFGLYYWGDKDYVALSGGKPYGSFNATGEALLQGMWNGNISAMSVYEPVFGTPLLYMYGYDQLNRLVSSQAYTGAGTYGTTWSVVALPGYKEHLTYDENGNILTLNRWSATAVMDSLKYFYNTGTNQLNYVSDAVTGNASLNLGDIQNQSANNYAYDPNGSMTQDLTEGVTGVTWNVYGKIASVTKTTGTIYYTYDAAGNRISEVANGDTTWYVRDATGNVMSIYHRNSSINLTQTEVPIYGSSRLGEYLPNVDVSVTPNPTAFTKVIFYRGKKNYELDDHRGNVYVVIDDKKIPVSNRAGTLDSFFMAQVVSADDYYTFGMLEPTRKYNSASAYRYGFNGQEKSLEIDTFANLTTAKYWEYDSRIGRRWNSDPKPNASLSNYSCFDLNPIYFSDINGDVFDVGSGTKARDDVKGITKPEYRKYIKIDENGHVSLDFSGLNSNEKDKVLKDGGIKLLSNLIGSKKKYYYGNDDYVPVFDSKQNEANVAYYDNSTNKGDGSINTILNLSDNGKNSADYNMSMLGYNGAVLIALNASYTQFENETSDEKVPLERSTVVFHELSENYERTEHGIDYNDNKANGYNGAHHRAIQQEKSSYWNPSTFPGQPTSQTGAPILENRPNIYAKYGGLFLLINSVHGTATAWERKTFAAAAAQILFSVNTQY